MINKKITLKKLRRNKNFVPCTAEYNDELYPNGIFVFNITKALAFIENNPEKIEMVRIKTSAFYSSPNINESHLDTVDLKKPVLMAEISPIGDNLIDGHHRFEKAKRIGRKTLRAYRLRVNQHVKFLTSIDAYNAYVDYWNGKVSEYSKRFK